MGALTTTYYPNDMVASLTQPVDNGAGAAVTKTNTYSLDPSGRIDTITTTTGGTETQRLQYRFSAGNDVPTSIRASSDAGVNWSVTRNIQIPVLGMLGSFGGSTFDWSLQNLHGDAVATQSANSGAVTLATYGETDEYGAAIAVGGSAAKYGYLGAWERSTDTVGGFVIMGARLYNPLVGGFLSADSVLNGGATRYAYPFDPVNGRDLDGTIWGWVVDQFLDYLLDYVIDGIGCFLCSGTGMICGALISAAITFIYRLVMYHYASG
ncbi:MAG: RHS repeat-associated core domain-containing protein [Nocardioides sp.]